MMQKMGSIRSPLFYLLIIINYTNDFKNSYSLITAESLSDTLVASESSTNLNNELNMRSIANNQHPDGILIGNLVKNQERNEFLQAVNAKMEMLNSGRKPNAIIRKRREIRQKQRVERPKFGFDLDDDSLNIKYDSDHNDHENQHSEPSPQGHESDEDDLDNDLPKDLTDKQMTNFRRMQQAITRHQSQQTHWETLFAPLDAAFAGDFSNDRKSIEMMMELSPRAFGGGLDGSKSPLLRAINPYGCYCNFKDMPSPFGGEPANEFDRACKALQEGYRCIQLDLGNSCSTEANQYQTSSKYIVNRDDNVVVRGLQDHCRRINPEDECGYNLCVVESYFISTLYNLLMTGHKLDMSKSHKMGFDPSMHCSRALPQNDQYDLYYELNNYDGVYGDNYINYDGDYDYTGEASNIPQSEGGNGGAPSSVSGQTNGSNASGTGSTDPSDPNAVLPAGQQSNKKKPVPDQCCGSYPKRNPYNPGQNRQCCEETHIYNNFTHQCCEDGTTKLLGQC